METKVEVKVFQIDYACDECGEPMRNNGYMQTSSPPKFPHECKSGHKQTFLKTYPTVEYQVNTGLDW